MASRVKCTFEGARQLAGKVRNGYCKLDRDVGCHTAAASFALRFVESTISDDDSPFVRLPRVEYILSRNKN